MMAGCKEESSLLLSLAREVCIHYGIVVPYSRETRFKTSDTSFGRIAQAERQSGAE